MGLLIDGVWKTDWYESDSEGAFRRPETRFRSWIKKGSEEGFEPEAGRYHLFVSYACPWAHRTLITRAFRGLEDIIGVTNVDPHMGDDGWPFGGEGEENPLFPSAFIRDVYLKADPKFTGRATVPVLWDKKSGRIVSNESREIMRMLDTAFEKLVPGRPSLLPGGKVAEVDAMLDRIYNRYNNGVYRAGFATQQGAYESAVRDVFTTLDECEEILSKQRYLCGSELSEADVAMFTTSIRFALVYYAHFKCNLRRIEDYPNIWAYVRELYQMPEFKKTTNLEQIKKHYYWSQTTINPYRIVPVGPTLDLNSPHGRERLG